MSIQWIVKPFDELTPHQVYAMLQLRNEIFVVEQHCVFQDADGYDPKCFHLLGYVHDELVAYTRLVPPGLIYPYASIGRVVTSKTVRRSGCGRLLMQRSIEEAYRLFGRGIIKIGAQLYLKTFYQSFGFVQNSDVYLEDGIEHIHMTLPTT